jgi:MFS family permease
MFKKNPIFWWASIIFVLGLILFAITQNQIFILAFIVAAYLLRSTLASLGIAKKYVDERQMNLNYRSSNIAFVVMMFACVFLAGHLMAKDDHTFEMFLMAIVIGIATKALFNVLLKKNFRETAPKIIISVGLLMTLFASISNIDHGIFSMSFIMNVLPCLFVVGVGITAKFYPRAASIGMFIYAALLIAFMCRRGFSWGTLGSSLIFTFPLLAASLGLWWEPKNTSEEVAG